MRFGAPQLGRARDGFGPGRPAIVVPTEATAKDGYAEQPSSPRSGAGSQRPWSTAPEAGELYRDVVVIIQIKFSPDIRVLFFT